MTGTALAPASASPALARTRVMTLAAVYLVLLVWAVLWKLELPWAGVPHERIVKLVPFVATGGAGASPDVDLVVNLVLFVPFGVYLGLLVPAWRWWTVAGAAAALSLALEVAQYVLAVGSSDVTDVVVNTAGALAGLGLAGLAYRRLGVRTTPVLARACTVGTALAVLAAALLVVSPLRFAAPEDVRCDVPSATRCGPPGVPGGRGA